MIAQIMCLLICVTSAVVATLYWASDNSSSSYIEPFVRKVAVYVFSALSILFGILTVI